jgi:AcrR family transcriptional regulator
MPWTRFSAFLHGSSRYSAFILHEMLEHLFYSSSANLVYTSHMCDDADTAAGSRAGDEPATLCHATGSRQPLSRDRIIAAATGYVDANCLDDLSMRRLGSELGVEAMSLYRYFPSKAALLDGVVCHALTDLDLPEQGSREWETDVRAYARSFRRLSREHPRLMPLLATTGAENHTLAEVTRRMIASWRSAGLDEPLAERAQAALQGYVTGMSVGGARSVESDEIFEFGLDALICGLRRAVDQPEAAVR